MCCCFCFNFWSAHEALWRRRWQPTPVVLLENSMDREARQPTVHGIAKSQTQRSNLTHRRLSLIKLFHLSDLLQMPSDHRMVDVEFLSIFLCSCKKNSFSILSVGHCQLPVSGHYAPHLQGSHLLAKLLEPPPHCTFISSSWVKCVDVASPLL